MGLRFQANIELTQRLNSESYLVDETITIRIPLSIPYLSDSEGFERVNGEFVHDGEFYKLVKQEFKKDTLYIVCIHDYKAKRNFNFMSGFAKLSTDMPASSKSTLKLFGSLLKDLESSDTSLIISESSIAIDINYASQQFNIIAAAHSVLSPPPDFLS